MSKKKYKVPAVKRANLVLEFISQHPGKFRLIDLSKKLEINKSSMYSLLSTMEELDWIVKNEKNTYDLSSRLGFFGSSYLKQLKIMEVFSEEAEKSIRIIDEHIQLGTLVDGDVFYINRKEGSSLVRLITDPGTRFPAYASAIGKIQLTQFTYKELKMIYKNTKFRKKTQFTVENIDQLWNQLVKARKDGFVEEKQEGAEGFFCVGAPIYNYKKELVYGVSFTMTESSWLEKRELAIKEIVNLAQRLSRLNGFI